MTKKTLILYALFFILTSCWEVNVKRHAGETDSVNRVRVNMDSSPPSLDPRLVPDRNTRTCVKALFEGLTRINPKGQAELSCASDVEVSPDQVSYTFTIRKSQWSNGDPVTAYDFAHAWKSALQPDFPSPFAHLFYPIKGAKGVKEGRLNRDAVGIRATNPHTLIVELEHPTPYFLNLVAHPIYSPVNQKVEAGDPNWYSRRGLAFVCNGPFMLVDWDPDKEMRLSANPTYWDGPVDSKSIEISFVKDPRTSLLMFEKGKLDWVGTPFCDLPIDALPTLKDKGILRSQLVSGVYWLNCNTKKPPLNSVKCRRALALALDRAALVDLIHQSSDTTAFSIVPKHATALHKLTAGSSNACVLFQEGLTELGIDLDNLPPIKLMVSDVSGQKSLGQAIQQQWKTHLGIDVKLCECDWNSFISNLLSGRYHIGGCVIDATFDDPICHLQRLQYADSNAVFWDSVEYRECLSLAQKTTDPSERRKLLGDAEELLQQEMPVIPINYDEYKYLVSDQIEGVFISTLGIADFKWIKIVRSREAALASVKK